MQTNKGRHDQIATRLCTLPRITNAEGLNLIWFSSCLSHRPDRLDSILKKDMIFPATFGWWQRARDGSTG